MGQSGATAMLILLFLAVTSACSAEQIAVSSILTYDIFGTYIRPNPSEKQILWVSHICIFSYALFMGAIATAFNYIGVSMGYLYELMGCIIGSAVVPIALCITWRKCNGTGACVGAVLGFCAGVAGWLGITSVTSFLSVSVVSSPSLGLISTLPTLTGILPDLSTTRRTSFLPKTTSLQQSHLRMRMKRKSLILRGKDSKMVSSLRGTLPTPLLRLSLPTWPRKMRNCKKLSGLPPLPLFH